MLIKHNNSLTDKTRQNSRCQPNLTTTEDETNNRYVNDTVDSANADLRINLQTMLLQLVSVSVSVFETNNKTEIVMFAESIHSFFSHFNIELVSQM